MIPDWTKWISLCPNCLRSNSKSSLKEENTTPNFKVSLLLFTHNIWHLVKNNQILYKDKSVFKNRTKPENNGLLATARREGQQILALKARIKLDKSDTNNGSNTPETGFSGLQPGSGLLLKTVEFLIRRGGTVLAAQR